MTILFFFFLWFTLTSPVFAADLKNVDLSVDKRERSYVYHVPAHHAAGALPVVLVLHDAGRKPEDALQQYRWLDLAERENFIVVGLAALPVDPSKGAMYQTNPTIWSNGSGQGEAKRGEIDDTAYVRAVLDDLEDRAPVDPKRIFATGFGNGGAMANRLGITLSDRLAAIAPVEGLLWGDGKPDTPLPVLMMFGGKDPVDPLDGGTGINVWTHMPEQKPPTVDSASKWAELLGCSAHPVITPPTTKTAERTWTTCHGGASVNYLVIPDLGHHWPGGEDDMLPANTTGPQSDFDGTGFIWTFFKYHPKG